MKLDRNTSGDGRGKYAVLNLRKLKQFRLEHDTNTDEDIRLLTTVTKALLALSAFGVLKYGNESDKDRFFVLKYSDLFTPPALEAYAAAIRAGVAKFDGLPVMAKQCADYLEYAGEVEEEARAASAAGIKLPD
jgi:hypothetical protein